MAVAAKASNQAADGGPQQAEAAQVESRKADMVRGVDGFEAQQAALAVKEEPGLLDRAASYAWSLLGYDDAASEKAEPEATVENAEPEADVEEKAKDADAGGQRDEVITPGEIAAAAKDEAASGAEDPLAKALGKVGKVKYKDSRFLKGGGDLTKAEVGKLVSGDDDIEFANCSTFTTWALAAAGIDVKQKGDGAAGNIQAYINIAAGLETGSLKGDIDADSDRIKGAAAGFTTTGIGVEVDKGAVKPGDFIQTWHGTGGHSTIAHRVHCKGAAIFGLPGSPTLVSGDVPQAGAGVAMGVDAPVAFIIDESTDPKLVGAHTVDKVEQLGANLAGKGADGKQHEAGVYTKAPVSLSDYTKAYVGRLNSSQWSGWAAADVAGYEAERSEKSEKGEAPAKVEGQEEESSVAGSLLAWARDTASEGMEMASNAAESVSEFIWGEGEGKVEADPKAAPKPEPAPKAFQAAGVRGCDYVVDPDGTINFMKGGQLKRSFGRDHALYGQLKAEILEVYPDLPY